MKERIKKLWVAALRSGKYKKGKRMLHPTKDRFCCLGVLTALYCDEKVKLDKTRSRLLDKNVVLPETVQKWAGLKVSDPFVVDRTLSRHNDGGYTGNLRGQSFKTISNLIEKWL